MNRLIGNSSFDPDAVQLVARYNIFLLSFVLVADINIQFVLLEK